MRASARIVAFAALTLVGLSAVGFSVAQAQSAPPPAPAGDTNANLQRPVNLSPEEMKSVPSMPASLEEALTCLEDDHSFLLKGDVFSEELLETFIAYKRKNEADAVRLRPHPHEFALYYDI